MVRYETRKEKLPLETHEIRPGIKKTLTIQMLLKVLSLLEACFDLVTLTFHENSNHGQEISENLGFKSLLWKVIFFLFSSSGVGIRTPDFQ